MNANKRDIESIWIDPDDAPELTDEWFEQADLYKGGNLVRRGRPTDSPSSIVQLDSDVLAAFRASGQGWQVRMNSVLRDWLKAHSPA
ncbi:MAG: BrnA antitoxin family protein [Magnetococcales bacterium]|nr:BrnA antitoxin family protein [Magnetococcales bacterium]MBF0271818.1 BrnA antitoxin family protein [Magnetococcales bacterium]